MAAGRLRSLSFDLVGRREVDQAALVARLEKLDPAAARALREALEQLDQALAGYAPDRDVVFADFVQNQPGSGLLAFALAAAALAEGRELANARAALRGTAALDDEIETVRLDLILRKFQSVLASDDPLLDTIFAGKRSFARAAALVRDTSLTDPGFRRILSRSEPAVARRRADPLVQLVRSLRPEFEASRRRLTHVYELSDRAQQLLEAARFQLDGDGAYPDGNGSLRVSFGAMRGYQDFGRQLRPFTTLENLFQRGRADGAYPLPAAWLQARGAMDLSVPLNVATDHDGMVQCAVLIDRAGDMVGLMFNGNRSFPGSALSYEGAQRRMVSVHGAAVVEVLRHVYRAQELLSELGVK
jgi:hypothetical protein